jgi:hypothetical protein
MYFKPGDTMIAGDEFPLSPDQLHDANIEHRDRHRVVVFTGASEYEVAALMRHELEHVRQQIELGDSSETLIMIHERTTDVLSDLYRSRPGIATLYNLMPMERDANAAAAAFVVSTYDTIPKDVRRGEHAPLFRHTEDAPRSFEDLGLRSLAFAATHATAFSTWAAANGQTSAGLFGSWVDGAEHRWAVIASDGDVRKLADASVAATPSDEEIAFAAPLPQAWLRSRDLLARAYERAVTLIT